MDGLKTYDGVVSRFPKIMTPPPIFGCPPARFCYNIAIKIDLIWMECMVETLLDCRGSHFQYVSRERTFWFSEKNPYVRVPAAILTFCYKML